jgi:hypothetical protein
MISANAELGATRRRAANAAVENAVVLISRGALEKRTGKIEVLPDSPVEASNVSAGFARLNGGRGRLRNESDTPLSVVNETYRSRRK